MGCDTSDLVSLLAELVNHLDFVKLAESSEPQGVGFNLEADSEARVSDLN